MKHGRLFPSVIWLRSVSVSAEMFLRAFPFREEAVRKQVKAVLTKYGF